MKKILLCLICLFCMTGCQKEGLPEYNLESFLEVMEKQDGWVYQEIHNIDLFLLKNSQIKCQGILYLTGEHFDTQLSEYIASYDGSSIGTLVPDKALSSRLLDNIKNDLRNEHYDIVSYDNGFIAKETLEQVHPRIYFITRHFICYFELLDSHKDILEKFDFPNINK